MTKYSNQFKLSAIKAFLTRGRGLRHLADRGCCGSEFIRDEAARSISRYRLEDFSPMNRSRKVSIMR